MTPLDYLLMRQNGDPPDCLHPVALSEWELTRLDSAREAAPYIHPQMERTVARIEGQDDSAPRYRIIENIRDLESFNRDDGSNAIYLPLTGYRSVDEPYGIVRRDITADAFQFTDAQMAALDMLAQDITHGMLFGGSRSGKSFLICVAIMMRALAAPGSRHLICRSTFSALKAAVIHDTFPKACRLVFPNTEVDLNRTDFIARVAGSEIYFAGLDDADRAEKILGQEFSTIAVEEASGVSHQTRNLLVTRLAQRCMIAGTQTPMRTKMFYTENPPNRNHWTFHLFVAKRNPETKQQMDPAEAGKYASMRINPSQNPHLTDDYVSNLMTLGERYVRRFVQGDWSDSNPNALFSEEMIDKYRLTDGEPLPEFQKICVAVDPSGASDDPMDTGHDAIGIISGALTYDGKILILNDATVEGVGPETWARVVISEFDRLGGDAGDLICAEVNFGSAMVGAVIKAAAPGRHIPYRAVTASRGKHVRAEPVATMVANGMVRFVGRGFAALEDEMLGMSTAGYTLKGSPNRLDALVWLCHALAPGAGTVRRVQAPNVRLNSLLDAPWSA